MFRIDVAAMAIALLLLFFACTSEPLPIGTPVKFSQTAPCAPVEAGLDQVRKAEKIGESEFYKAMDRAQAIQVKAGDSATVITSMRDKVRIRLPEGSVNRLPDNTCWISRSAIAK
jgi:hypothetical protein